MKPLYEYISRFNHIQHIENKSLLSNGCGKLFIYTLLSCMQSLKDKHITFMVSMTNNPETDYIGLKKVESSPGTSKDYLDALHGKIYD